MLSRRSIIRRSAALSLGGIFNSGVVWSQTDAAVRTILPSVSHDALALKILLDRPPSGPPELFVEGRGVAAHRMDADGYAWGVVQRGLKGGSAYRLELRGDTGRVLRAPWTISTLPPPKSEPSHTRILFFTCAGGDEEDGYLSIAERRALLDRALSFSPDLAVANGDHIYWDTWTALKYNGSPASRAANAALHHRIAWIDEDSAFDSPTNRQSLNTIVGRQIASLYEDRFASVPLLFVSDDHDYFENDNAGPWGCTFPPRPFTLNLQQRTAAMAYPIALGRPNLGDARRSETVESIKIGNLLEMALFDSRRGWSTGKDARLLFPEAEAFLLARLRQSDAHQYIQVPSLPFGITAGKLGEWYGDPASSTSTYSDDKGAYWQKGWFEQHQRLVNALSAQKTRAAISISGDMHAFASTLITRSGDLDLSGNPIRAILPGPLGTGKEAFPSAARGALPRHPADIEARDDAPLEERNGFSIVDVTREDVLVRQFRWRSPEPFSAIAGLQPYNTIKISRHT